MKWTRKCAKRAMGLLTAAVMLFSFVLSGGTTMTAKADGGEYKGATVSASGVTFYYYDTTNTHTKVYMKGSWDGSWGAHIPLTNDGNGVWSVTVPFSGDGVTGVEAFYGDGTPGGVSGNTTVTFEKGTTYAYGFEDNVGGEWIGTDDNNPKVGGNSEIVGSPVISADGVKLYYYPEHGTYPTMTVKYREKGSSTAWADAASVTMNLDTTYTAILSATIDTATLASGTYEYKMYKNGTEVADNLVKEQIFKVSNIPAEDPSVKSPVVKDNDVTFNYYGPTANKVTVKGEMIGWAEKALTKNEATGYWSLTISGVAKGTYQYGFMVDNNWTEDKLNTAEKVGGNNVFTITNELQTKVKSPVVNAWGTTFNYYAPDATRVQLAGELTGWTEDTVADMIQDAEGWWTITIPNAAAGDYGYKFVENGDFSNGWKQDPLNASRMPSSDNCKVTVKGTESGISPVIEGTKVTFVYPENPKTSEKVRLAGDLTTPQWGDSEEEFTYNTSKKQWEYTKTVAPGSYAYKFIKNASDWMTDPANEETTADGNSKLLIAGLTDTSIQAEKGVATKLPETVKYYAGDGTEHQVKVTYSLPSGVIGVSISDGNITVEKSYTGKNIAVTMKAGEFEATLTVIPVEDVYNYTIYYFDKNHQTTDSSDLWLWEVNGAPGAAYDFTETEVLEDGRTWLKATVSASYTNFGMIARSKGEWSWQGPDVYYTNTDKNKNITLYLVADDTTAYTTLPKITEAKDRYAMIEYVRSAGDYDNWYLYTWNSGFGSEVDIPLTTINGKQYFKVPIKKNTKSLSFVVHRKDGEDAWAEKDGGDNSLSTPLKQTVTKATYTQGQGISYIYPENMGYKLDTKNGRVGFFYRDDDLVLEGKLNTLEGKVQVEIDGNTYDMIYDADTDRFVYYYNSLTEGDHYYRFCIDGNYQLDAYNDRVEERAPFVKATDNNLTNAKGANGTLVEYSVYTYKKYATSASAEFSQKTVDYTQNSVLKVTANKVDDMEVSAVTADISALGGNSQFVIDPQLMAGTIAVNENVKPGTYTIPITVKDQYENEYTTSATITVTEKTGNDFDWDEAIIYFMVTDRFYDGNTSNNIGVEKDNPSGYHGGDFAGVTQKLDYLKELGINTIWITPIVDNIDDALTTEVPGITSHGYHGYWAKDFTTLDPTLGTEAEFQTLISEAHSRGIKIMVDVVLNHAGYNTESVFGDMIRSSAETVSGDDQLAPLSGLPDFATEKAEVRNQLVAWQTAWMTNYDIDYFRVDTVKHVDDTTWKAFKNSLTEANPAFKMIGEYSGAGYTFDGGQLRTGQMDSLLDFDFNDFGQQFVTGSISSIEKKLEERNKTIDNTATLGNFLSSHDEDGLVYKLINENGMTEKEALNKMLVAASLQITAKGQPVVYYGEEIGLYGANNYPYQTNRYDFDWSKVTSDNKILNHYKGLLAARNVYSEVFAKGERVGLGTSDADGYVVFDRVYEGRHVVTALNTTDKAKTITFDLKKVAVDDVYTNLITSGYGNSSKIDGTKVTLTIPAASEGGTYMFTYADNKQQQQQQEAKLENTVIKTGDVTQVAGLVLMVLSAAVVMAEIARKKKYC